jgi:hypothetical protein
MSILNVLEHIKLQIDLILGVIFTAIWGIRNAALYTPVTIYARKSSPRQSGFISPAQILRTSSVSLSD